MRQEEIIRNREFVGRALKLLGIKRYATDYTQIDRPDVGVIIDGVKKVGVEVTGYHWDAGDKGSLMRPKEKEYLKSGQVYSMWGDMSNVDELIRLVDNHIKQAEEYGYSNCLWLLVAFQTEFGSQYLPSQILQDKRWQEGLQVLDTKLVGSRFSILLLCFFRECFIKKWERNKGWEGVKTEQGKGEDNLQTKQANELWFKKFLRE